MGFFGGWEGWGTVGSAWELAGWKNTMVGGGAGGRFDKQETMDNGILLRNTALFDGIFSVPLFCYVDGPRAQGV